MFLIKGVYSGVTASMVERRIAQGYGQGVGPQYRPWLPIHRVPSKGLSSRVKSWTCRRLHHLLSLNERNFFFWMDWSVEIVDIREQFPLLPLSETVEIAREHGLHHPRDIETGEPIVMTTDFRLTEFVAGRTRDLARCVKPADKLTPKTLEKLEVERRYWARRGIDWRVVAEPDLPLQLCRNVEYVHRFFDLRSLSPLTMEEVNGLRHLVMHLVGSSDIALSDLTRQISTGTGYPNPIVMNVVKHLIATREIEVEMQVPITPHILLAVRR